MLDNRLRSTTFNLLFKKDGLLRRLLSALVIGLFSSHLYASPWVGTLDPQLHQDLVTLVEFEVVDAAATTYPVPWKGIADQILHVDQQTLPQVARNALVRLRHYLRQQQSSDLRSFAELYAASDSHRFTSFDGEQAPSARFSQLTEYSHGAWSAQLALNVDSGGEKHLDQSYIAYQVAGWTFSISALDQWWGPGQSSSLILSNNARPVPSIGISRAQAVRSKSKWLSWLGPWYFSAQMGQLESQRAVPRARLWRTRFTFKPVNGLELGASWAAMWGGKNQPNGFSDFIDVVTFRTECINKLITCEPELETTKGNHIAGFDAKYTFHLFQTPTSLYAQRIGEDAKDRINITDNANLFGMSTYLFGARIYLENSDTNVACIGDGSSVTNCFYEHGTYTDGYRRYQRALASTFDSDAKQTTLGMNLHLSNADSIALQASYIELNPDQSRPSPVLTDSVSEELWYVTGFYQTAWRDFQIKLGATLSLRDLQPETSKTDMTAYINIRYALF